MTEEQVTQQSNEQRTERRKKRERKRLFPIWLRLVIVAALITISTVVGAIVGYSGLGNGKPLDALKPSTWQRIIDIVKKDTKSE
ncbi:DNA-directed RNA polymerase subunit beta [Anoxybacteroides amylolyticum]|uniref:DNA-directed RNA polymerase subunit beta family protein n=1 Tax=Anoxybacteroides amylolyticum TaxID=294699 RepID=A0A160F138_9BACL|nr:DNA-directed RNA polymerase subunit beta [Anoxybacillus amylolyticus]ANB59275.1 DNA-directed RNA polymerase subunit beta family protein [Anoxybacillus amylolyticus]